MPAVSLRARQLSQQRAPSILRGTGSLSLAVPRSPLAAPSKAGLRSPASLRSATSQPCGHFRSSTPYTCPRGFAAPSPAARGEVVLGETSQAISPSYLAGSRGNLAPCANDHQRCAPAPIRGRLEDLRGGRGDRAARSVGGPWRHAGADRPQRLRQDHGAADGAGAAVAGRRPGPLSRRVAIPRQCAAGTAVDGLRRAGGRTVSAPHGRAERQLDGPAPALATRTHRATAGRARRADPFSHQRPWPLSVSAIGRPATAGGPDARAHAGPRSAALR